MTEPCDSTEVNAVAEMRAELAALRSEVAALRERADERLAHPEQPATLRAAIDRRSWMKAAAAAAVGGTALALGTSQPAAAASNMQIGSTANQDAARTLATHTGTDGDVSFLFVSRPTHVASFGESAAYAATLGGWAYQPDTPNGIYGYTAQTTGDANGVIGITNSAQGAGVLAINLNEAGVGLRAIANSSGWGVEATGKTGVSASGDEYGIQVDGGAAAIYIPPANPIAPPDRGTTQSPGAIDTHSSNLTLGTSHLWFCVDGGVGGGDWRKLAGPDTAGAFHAVDPFRAYDSRRAVPAPGRLAAGANRVVSIKDARNVATGAVIGANIVPARARAVTYNVTATGTLAAGFLAVAPGDAATSTTAAVNWSTSGQTIGNAGVVKLDASRQIKVFCGGATASTDFVIDITGYYL